MAIAQIAPCRETPSEGGYLRSGPFGLSWPVALLISEAMFVLSRAGVQDVLSVNNLACWIAGLAPFVIQFCAGRLFSIRSASLVELWMLSLAARLVFQLSDLTHRIEYPINLSFDIGLGRSLITASVYIALALLPLLAFALFRNDRTTRARSYASAALVVIPVLAVSLFLPY